MAVQIHVEPEEEHATLVTLYGDSVAEVMQGVANYLSESEVVAKRLVVTQYVFVDGFGEVEDCHTMLLAFRG